jgi:ribonuclease G
MLKEQDYILRKWDHFLLHWRFNKMIKVNKEIIINVSSAETRIAFFEDHELVELYVERPENERMVGNIYKGKIKNIVNAVQAAFVDIGLEQNGFLPFADIGEKVYEFSGISEAIIDTKKKGKTRRKKSNSNQSVNLKMNQDILVQVTKEPIGNKGARLTTDLSLPGRLLVLILNNSMAGVSRKIGDLKERNRLRRLARSLRPEGFGLIIRTVAVGKDVQTIRSDMEGLIRIWKRIEEKAKATKVPTLLHKDAGMTSSIIRDLFSPDINRLVVDSQKLYREIRRYLKDVAPGLLSKLEIHKGESPVFDDYKVEDEIDRSFSRKIWFKGGGYLIFDQAEALVVVDVNSGRSVVHKDHEYNALKVNMEASREIARQLRLRDIGGIIVIDFIDMGLEKNRKKVVSELKKELNKDRAAFDILQMNDFGLVSITRERVRPSLLFRYSEPCPRCEGLGRIPAKSTVVTKIERKIKQMKKQYKGRYFILTVQPDLAVYLKEGIKSSIRQLMIKHLVAIKLITDTSLREEDFKLETAKQRKKVL